MPTQGKLSARLASRLYWLGPLGYSGEAAPPFLRLGLNSAWVAEAAASSSGATAAGATGCCLAR